MTWSRERSLTPDFAFDGPAATGAAGATAAARGGAAGGAAGARGEGVPTTGMAALVVTRPRAEAGGSPGNGSGGADRIALTAASAAGETLSGCGSVSSAQSAGASPIF